MPAWPGGPCPDCGDQMPANLLRCRTCGAMLNPSLEMPQIDAPDLGELPEVKVVTEVEAKGFYVGCPNCEAELRIAAKYAGNQVACKFCELPFIFKLDSPTIRRIAVYAPCPYCREELRIAEKYLGKRVGCKHCDGAIRPTLPKSK